jgi:uncharacterized membrane protein YfcA
VSGADFAAAVMLGVLAGAFAGARVLPGAHTQSIRLLFAIVVAALALELLFRAIQKECRGVMSASIERPECCCGLE